jgi:DNA-binding transcriptional MocR family regulator
MTEPPPAVSSLVPDQSFLLASFSKVMAPGLRVGYLEASPPWLDKVAASIRSDCWMVAPLMPEIVTLWLESGTAERLIERQRAAIAERLQLATQCLQGQVFRWAPDMPHLYLPLPEPWRTETFSAATRQAGVLVRTMDHFAAGRNPPPQAVRISLNAADSFESLRVGLQTLVRILRGDAIPT